MSENLKSQNQIKSFLICRNLMEHVLLNEGPTLIKNKKFKWGMFCCYLLKLILIVLLIFIFNPN
jgi:hypothetical protein